MARLGKTLLLAALVILISGQAANAGWLHFANSAVRAEEESQQHPQTLTQVIVVHDAATVPYFCAGYHNTAAKKGKGRVVAKATIVNFFGGVDTITFAGGVKENNFLKCKRGKSLFEGDVVTFEYEFKKMPRLRAGDGEGEFAEVSSVISTAGAPQFGEVSPQGLVPPSGAEPLGLIPSASGGWLHTTRSVFQPDEGVGQHPEELSQTLVVPAQSTRPEVCIGYSNMADEGNKGRIVAMAAIEHEDGEIEAIDFAGGVKRNEYLNCKRVERDLVPGDIVSFSYELKGLPRLKPGAFGAEFADINGIVSTSGTPLFREPPPPPPPPVAPPPPAPKEVPAPSPQPPPSNPAPNNPAPSPPATGGGGISAADEQAAFRLFKSARQTQLHRAKQNSPAKWVVIGSKSKLKPGTNDLDFNTTGRGSTIASAVADYERKYGSFGSSGALSSSERSLLGWYGSIDASAGPTAVRRDGKGTYHGEYYRPSHGVQHRGPLGTLQSALDFLKGQGL